MVDSVKKALERIEQRLMKKLEHLYDNIIHLESELASVRQGLAALRVVKKESPSTHSQLTMKELTLKALKEQFPKGATARQLVDFFALGWNRRDIQPDTLRPQLSRLKAEGKISREGHIWRLITTSMELAENRNV